MENKLLVEVGIHGLPYNLYDVVIRELREIIITKFNKNDIFYSKLEFNFSKNRIIFFVKFNDNYSMITIEEVIRGSLSELFIPVQDLKHLNSLLDYIIWIQGKLDDEELNFANFLRINDHDNSIKFFKISSVDSYIDKLKYNDIILENEKRRDYLLTKSKKIAKEYGGLLYNSNYLIEKYINEYNLPFPILKKFDNELLEYPKELIINILLDVCNVFPILNEKGIIMPYFIFCVEKNDSNNDEKIDNIFNEKINILLDAIDKYNKTIKHDYNFYLERMKNTQFPTEIGTIYDKTNRIRDLGIIIGTYLDVGDNTLNNIETEANICKLDLTTDIVKEMPALKGTIGYLYAKNMGYNDIITNSIYMHYKPRFYHDTMPETTSAKILSIADKLDTITNSFIYNILNFKIDKYQTTYIRRNTSGFINVIIDNNWDLNLLDLLDDLIYIYIKHHKIVTDYSKLKLLLHDFILLRFREELINRNFDYKEIDSLIKLYPDNLSRVYDILKKGGKYEQEKFSDSF